MQDLFNLLGFDDRKQIRCLQRLGNGRAVSVFVPAGDPEALVLLFERKIDSEDVRNGKLLPLTVQTTKRRGGKRAVTLVVSYESAEALHKMLGIGLKRLRRRRLGRELLATLWGVTLAFVESQKLSVYPLSLRTK